MRGLVTVFYNDTVAARRVMVAALDLVQRLGDRQMGTEHLLLALLGTGGAAAAILRQVGTDQRRVTENLTGNARLPRRPVWRRRSGAMRMTGHAQAALAHAREESVRSGHGAVRTEHLLLGLLEAHDSRAYRTLVTVGVDPDVLRRRIRAALAGGGDDAG